MITIDCPLCAGDATTDEALVVVACDHCGVVLEVAADPSTAALAAPALDLAT
jgi:hypothetical protein